MATRLRAVGVFCQTSCMVAAKGAKLQSSRAGMTLTLVVTVEGLFVQAPEEEIMRPQRISQLPIALGLGILFLVAGCSANDGEGATESSAPPTTSQNSTPPQDSPAPASSATASASISASATSASLTLFYVAVGDAGKAGPEIGCGDSLVATETGPKEFTNQVEASITALLANDAEELGSSGLRNALAASDLDYVSSMVDGDVVTVRLNGAVSSSGTCDDPRIVEQLKYTAMTAAGTGQAEILVDGEKIEEALSSK